MKKRKPLILLSLAATNPPTYRKAIHSAGGTPIGGYLPECETPDSFDGLLLGGGGDLDPNWYGEVNRASDTLDHRRDELEHELIKKAIALEIPILGICRGIQILTGMLGGTLIQDLGVVHSMTEESYRLHAAYAKAGSRIETLYGKSIVINSGHHQAVKRLAPGFIATQWSCDGVIEAMEHETLPILGVQWHPEQMCTPSPTQQSANGMLLFYDFIACCAKRISD